MSSRDRTLDPDPRADVILAHDPNAGPLTDVRNIVIQASLAQLQAKGYYARYSEFIASDVREDLLSRIAPGWIPIDLAIAHYNACDKLDLSSEELKALGVSVGAQVSDVTLVAHARKVRGDQFDLRAALVQLHRMWPRIYRGGSVQVLRMGPNDVLIEQRGLVLNGFKYFRQSQVMSITAAHESVGIQVTSVKIDRYSAVRDEIVYRMLCQ